jgi:Xaa-Pro dipeptidase
MSERPVLTLYCADGRAAAVVPALEAGRTRSIAADSLSVHPYTDEEGYGSVLASAAELLGIDGGRCAVEYLHMRVLELRALESAAPRTQFVSLEEELPGLRVLKDRAEIAAIQAAIEITERALHQLIAQPLLGLSERQVAARLEQEMRAAGADGPAFIMVVGGVNTANPHAEPSARRLERGDFVTIDCGVTKDGYHSDITRTFVIAEPTPLQTTIYETVRRANEAGRRACGPGVSAQAVDRAARAVIREAGHGEQFVHRTGHGLGMEVHEPPYIVEGNEQLLQDGMVFTVEPGIYVPGLGGVRIEDNVVVTDDGAQSLTSFPRELLVIA